jgi:hypothetical protein
MEAFVVIGSAIVIAWCLVSIVEAIEKGGML